MHKSLDGLVIQYKGQTQERITVTKIVFWNEGKDTIDANDLVEKDQVRVIAPNTIDVLDINIIDVSSNSNSVSLGEITEEEESNFYPIIFEYLDHQDYFVIQIIHNGSTDESFDILGKIKGVKSIVHGDNLSLTKSQSKLIKLLPFLPPLESLMTDPLFVKYFGSITYASIGGFAIWNLAIGNTEWYVWLGAAFCFIAALIMYFGFRHTPPVKI